MSQHQSRVSVVIIIIIVTVVVFHQFMLVVSGYAASSIRLNGGIMRLEKRWTGILIQKRVALEIQFLAGSTLKRFNSLPPTFLPTLLSTTSTVYKKLLASSLNCLSLLTMYKCIYIYLSHLPSQSAFLNAR